MSQETLIRERLLQSRVFVLLALCGFGLGGNMLSTKLFFGVSLIFGSIATMLAILALGRWQGVVVAFVASLYTYVIWGHPYAVVIFTAEAVFVAYLSERIRVLVVRDIIFWLFVGCPLVLMFYHGNFSLPILELKFLALPLDSAFSIFYKQSLNGILNALIAGVLYIVYRVVRGDHSSFSIRSVIFYATLACLLAPALSLVVMNARQTHAEMEYGVQRELMAIAELSASLMESTEQVSSDTDLGDGLGAGVIVLGGGLERRVDGLRRYVVFDDSHDLLNGGASLPVSLDMAGVEETASGLMVWRPTSDARVASMRRWREAVYFVHLPVYVGEREGLLVVELSAQGVIDRLHDYTNELLFFLFCGTGFAAMVSAGLGHVLGMPLTNLRRESKGIPQSVREGKAIRIGRSWLVEVDGFAKYFSELAVELRERFKEIQQAGEVLEMQVEERTAELREERERLDIALQSAQAGVWEYDLRSGFLDWDERMFEIYGVDPDTFSNAYDAWASSLDEEGRVVAEQLLAQAIVGEKKFSTVFSINHPSGERRFVQAYARVIRSSTGEAMRMIGLNFDVTQLHELQRETQLQAAILSASGNSIVVTDVRGRIEWVNKAFYELTGYTLAEVRGRKPGEFLQGDKTDPRTVVEMGHCLAEGRGFEVELINYHKLGYPYWVDLRVDPVYDESDRLINFCAIQVDITARKRTEQDLRLETDRANKMACEAEEANRVKGEFLANMSHEIRTPLNGILGMAELLSKTTLTSEQMDQSQTIMSCCDQLLVVVNDVLDISKIAAGKLELESIEFDLLSIVRDLETVFGRQAEQAGLGFSCHVGAKCPQFLVGDPTRIRQILFNLIGNALKFTEAGAVVVSIRAMASSDEGCTLKIAVRDSGIGIPESRMGRLFEPFSQIDASDTRKYGGTGLGLTICKSLSEAMGGDISVTSQAGVGSVFTVELPLAVSDRTPLKELSSDSSLEVPEGISLGGSVSSRPLSILVVEDSLVNQRVAEQMLKGVLNCSVEIVGDGAQSISFLRRHEVDLVLMDCQMPVMDGLEASKRIRSDSSVLDQEVVIVAMTANVLGQQREDCLRAGMDDFLAKPVKMESIRELMQRLVDVGRLKFSGLR